MQTDTSTQVPQAGDRRHFLNVGVSHHRLSRKQTVGQIAGSVDHHGVELVWFVYSDGRPAEWRIQEPADPIKIDYIEVTRLEGLASECDEPVKCYAEVRPGDGLGGMFHDDWIAPAFYAAQHKLNEWASSMRGDGGYDKCRYVIKWPDDSYTGRYDMTNPPDELRQVFMNELIFWSGLAGTPFQMGSKNAIERWTDEEIRQRYIGMIDKHPDSRDFFRQLLAKYEI